jgi:hypothetical protein
MQQLNKMLPNFFSMSAMNEQKKNHVPNIWVNILLFSETKEEKKNTQETKK